jgi:hypothetical protein
MGKKPSLSALDAPGVPATEPRQGRDEMNLAEYPLALLADRVPKGQKTICYANTQGTVTITGSDAYGLPTAADTDVLIGLIQLTRLRNGFASPKVNFTRYELRKLLGWPDESKYYQRLDDSLNRWVGVTLHYDNTWWDNRAKRYLTAKLHILETVIIDEERPGRKKKESLPASSFTWNKTFIESCQADNLKRLDLDRYFGFQSAISKRIFRFLDKRFYLRPEWAFDLNEFAFEHIGISRNYAGNAGKIKEKLRPALDELETMAFLLPLPREDRFQKRDGGWIIRLVRSPDEAALEAAGPATTSVDQPPEPEPAPAPARAPVPSPAEELATRGVTPSTAAEIVAQFPAEVIAVKLDVFDWLSERNDRRVRVNPAGYLVDSIRKGYAPPRGFETKEARLCRREAERQAEAADRLEADVKARARAERESIDRYWQSLDPEQRSQLDAEALALADRDAWEACKSKPALARLFRRSLRDEYIRKVLAEREAKVPGR